jgi:hypothetical protein
MGSQVQESFFEHLGVHEKPPLFHRPILPLPLVKTQLVKLLPQECRQ